MEKKGGGFLTVSVKLWKRRKGEEAQLKGVLHKDLAPCEVASKSTLPVRTSHTLIARL